MDEIRGKVVKVKDLLQHSAELGNMEALYKLAYISLVGPILVTLTLLLIPYHSILRAIIFLRTQLLRIALLTSTPL